jgi:hypothetical protein
MFTSPTWIAIAIVAVAIVALLVFFVGKGKKVNRLTPLASLAFAFVVSGIIFGEERIIGYSLLGVGVILAVVDIFNRSKNK